MPEDKARLKHASRRILLTVFFFTCSAEHGRAEVVEEFGPVGLWRLANPQVWCCHSNKVHWLNPPSALIHWIKKLFHVQEAHRKATHQAAQRVTKIGELGHLLPPAAVYRGVHDILLTVVLAAVVAARGGGDRRCWDAKLFIAFLLFALVLLSSKILDISSSFDDPNDFMNLLNQPLTADIDAVVGE